MNTFRKTKWLTPTNNLIGARFDNRPVGVRNGGPCPPKWKKYQAMCFIYGDLLIRTINIKSNFYKNL